MERRRMQGEAAGEWRGEGLGVGARLGPGLGLGRMLALGMQVQRGRILALGSAGASSDGRQKHSQVRHEMRHRCIHYAGASRRGSRDAAKGGGAGA